MPAAPPCTADTQTDILSILSKARLGEGGQAQDSPALGTATLPVSYSMLTLSSPGVTSAAGSSGALSEDSWLPSSWEMVELSETERALVLNPCWHRRPGL